MHYCASGAGSPCVLGRGWSIHLTCLPHLLASQSPRIGKSSSARSNYSRAVGCGGVGGDVRDGAAICHRHLRLPRPSQLRPRCLRRRQPCCDSPAGSAGHCGDAALFVGCSCSLGFFFLCATGHVPRSMHDRAAGGQCLMLLILPVPRIVDYEPMPRHILCSSSLWNTVFVLFSTSRAAL